MEDNRGEVQVDQTAYYAAIRADFMELTRTDWTYMNMQDASWSTVSFAIYQVRPGTDSKTRRQLQKMDPEALRTYYNRFYSTHTDSDPPCPVERSVVYLPNQSGGESHLKAAAKRRIYLWGADHAAVCRSGGDYAGIADLYGDSGLYRRGRLPAGRAGQ